MQSLAAGKEDKIWSQLSCLSLVLWQPTVSVRGDLLLLSPGKTLNGSKQVKEGMIQSSSQFGCVKKQSILFQNNPACQLEVKQRNSPAVSTLVINFFWSYSYLLTDCPSLHVTLGSCTSCLLLLIFPFAQLSRHTVSECNGREQPAHPSFSVPVLTSWIAIISCKHSCTG